MRYILLSLFLLALPAHADPITDALNAFRASQGKPPVTRNAQLNEAARIHAEDMARRGYFNHTSPEGGTMSQRIASTGYQACLAAENIAQGYADAGAVLQGWANSRGHRRNMLSNATAYGLAEGPDRMWVMVLARPC